MQPFFLRKYPCPECYGNVPWSANRCPHCEHPVGASNRFDWLPLWMKPLVFVLLCSGFTLSGLKAAGGLVIVWAIAQG